MNFRRWVVFSFAMHVLVVLLDKGAGIVLSLLLAENPDFKGVADLLTTLPFILMAVANLGLATSLVYFVRRGKHSVQAVAETTSLVAIVWGGFVAIAGIGLMLGLIPILKPEWTVRASLVWPVCACVPFLLLASYYNSIQLATEKVRDYNVVHVLSSAAFLPCFLLFFWLGGGGAAAAEGVAYGRLSVAVLIAFVVLWMLRGTVRFRPKLHREFLRDGLAFGWKANITSVLTYLNHRLDLILLPMLFVPLLLTGDAAGKAIKAEIAFYSLAVTLAELVWHFPEALRDLFFSKVAGETHDRARVVTPVLARMCLFVAVIGTAAIALGMGPLFHVLDWVYEAWRGKPDVFTTNWLPSVAPAYYWLAPGAACFTLAKILQNDLAARGHLGTCIVACLVNLVTMIGLDVLWVPTEGALGAARASSLSFLVASAYTLWAYQRHGGAKWWTCVVPHPSDWVYVREILDAVLVKLRLRRKPS